VDKLLVIKDKVTEEHKLVDEWTGRKICKLFSNISKTIHALFCLIADLLHIILTFKIQNGV